jgi:hypothetical protein
MSKETQDKALIGKDESAKYEAKCVELAEKYNVPKVYVCVQFKIGDEERERIVSYIKEPDYMTKLVAMDKAGTHGMHLAAEELRMVNILQEESHPLTYGDSIECEPYKLGVAQFCLDIIKIALNVLKKN